MTTVNGTHLTPLGRMVLPLSNEQLCLLQQVFPLLEVILLIRQRDLERLAYFDDFTADFQLAGIPRIHEVLNMKGIVFRHRLV